MTRLPVTVDTADTVEAVAGLVEALRRDPNVRTVAQLVMLRVRCARALAKARKHSAGAVTAGARAKWSTLVQGWERNLVDIDALSERLKGAVE